jgi:hypothetical protein
MPSFFKAVPKSDLTGIRHNGLDPSRAMKVGGATMTAMAQVGRTPTATDKTAGTWLGKYEETARDYLDDEKIREGVILKITLPDDWLERLTIALHTPHGIGTSPRCPAERPHAGPSRSPHGSPSSIAPPPTATLP